MSAQADIHIKGMDRLNRMLMKLKGFRGAIAGLRAAALHVKGKIDVYPPASEANTPFQRRWYERGFGSKWMRRDGSIGSNKSSETLGRRWTTSERNAGLTQVVGNNVSYAKYVHDKEFQAAFHKARGWKTTEQVLEEEKQKIAEFVAESIMDDLKHTV